MAYTESYEVEFFAHRFKACFTHSLDPLLTVSLARVTILQTRNPENQMTSLQLMLDIEKQHLDSTIRSSSEKLGALLCDGFREFGASGKIWDKAETLKSVSNSTKVIEYKIDDYQIVQLGEAHILATYKLSARRDNQLRSTLRSTVWKLVGTKWQILFHQGTQQAE